MTLTDLTIRRAKPRAKRYQIADRSTPGLHLRIHPTGDKVFGFVFTDKAGKQIRTTLGTYGVIDLVTAREMALQARKDDLKPPSMTFAEAVDLFLTLHSARRNRPLTRQDHRRHLAKHFLPVWADRDVRDIRKREIVAILDKIARVSGPSGADHVLSTIRRLFYWLTSRGDLDLCPAVRMPRYSSGDPRDRVLSDDELLAVWGAATEMRDPYGDCLRLILLTGQRPGEVCGLKWSEIAGADWTLPGARSKNRLASVTPLVTTAVAILDEIRAGQKARGISSPCVFPNRNDHARAMVLTTQRRDRHRQLAGFADFTPHDLRRTLRTGLARLGVPEHVAERVIHHVPDKLKRTYDRYQYLDEKRDALARWERHVLAIIAG